MYFSNIGDTELAQYHNEIKNNFIMILTEALTSDLFKVETIIADNIYKVYPLFYCEEIQSSNPNDKILDNKCIICQKDNNTILTFKTVREIKEIDLNYQINYSIDGIIVYCNDRNTGNPIKDVIVVGEVEQTSPSQTESFEGVTGEDGFYYHPFNINWNTLTSLTLEYDGVTYNPLEE